jgi:hypothetical protein
MPHLMDFGGDEITNVGPISWSYRTMNDRGNPMGLGQYITTLEHASWTLMLVTVKWVEWIAFQDYVLIGRKSHVTSVSFCRAHWSLFLQHRDDLNATV